MHVFRVKGSGLKVRIVAQNNSHNNHMFQILNAFSFAVILLLQSTIQKHGQFIIIFFHHLLHPVFPLDPALFAIEMPYPMLLSTACGVTMVPSAIFVVACVITMTTTSEVLRLFTEPVVTVDAVRSASLCPSALFAHLDDLTGRDTGVTCLQRHERKDAQHAVLFHVSYACA